MKTTIEIPDDLFRKAKARAAERGESLKEFVNAAVRARLARPVEQPGEPPWMRGFGRLRHLRAETARIQQAIDETFEVVEAEDRA